MSKPTISDLMIACMDHGIDSERGSEAIVTIINANGWHSRHVSKAVEVALVNLEAHGYPEPYVAPEPEKCPSCFTPKSPCSCGAFPVSPEVPPDVPGWMVAGKDVSTREKPSESAPGKKDPRVIDDLPKCLCGGFARWASAAMGKIECSKRCGHSIQATTINGARAVWKKTTKESSPSWDNPPPCICGSNNLAVCRVSAICQISCQDCCRLVYARFRDIENNPEYSSQAVLRDWTAGKGEAGKSHYVESKPVGPVITSNAVAGCVTVDAGSGKAYVNGEEVTPIQASPWPCKCGAGVPTVGKASNDRWYIHCLSAPGENCTNYASSSIRAEAVRQWDSHYGIQPKGETPDDELKPCACESVTKPWLVRDGSRWVIACQGCGEKMYGEGTRAQLVTAWNDWGDGHRANKLSRLVVVHSEELKELTADLSGLSYRGRLSRTEKGLHVGPPEPTWDNPGPCVCGGTVLDKWDGSDGGGAYIRCSYHEGGCGRHREKPTMALALAAWVNREADKGES